MNTMNGSGIPWYLHSFKKIGFILTANAENLTRARDGWASCEQSSGAPGRKVGGSVSNRKMVLSWAAGRGETCAVRWAGRPRYGRVKPLGSGIDGGFERFDGTPFGPLKRTAR